MAEVWLTSMEQRLDELEQRVFGTSDKEISYPKVLCQFKDGGDLIIFPMRIFSKRRLACQNAFPFSG